MINLRETAECIVEVLENCGFNDISDSSGYYVIREHKDGTEDCVDVYKSNNGERPRYIVYCIYADDSADFMYTKDLSVEELLRVLEAFYANEMV